MKPCMIAIELFLAAVGVMDDPLSYESQRKKAIKTGQPLVVFNKCDPVMVPFRVLFAESPPTGLSGYPYPCVIVSIARAGELYWLATLPSNATVDQIEKAIAERKGMKVVSQQAVPFEDSSNTFSRSRWYSILAALPGVADADLKGVGLTPYERALWTQEIATTNNAPRISRVDRRLVPLSANGISWLVPGGMQHATSGYYSNLYKYVPAGQRDYQMRLPVKNSFGSYQHELGLVREYPGGTLFVDVLSTDMGVFEVRAREKVGREWISYVVAKDAANRPAGYTGLKQSCASCHSAPDGPGTGGYAAPLVPGSDTVFSDGLFP